MSQAQPQQQPQQLRSRRQTITWHRDHIRALIDIRRDTNEVNIIYVHYSFFIIIK